MRPLALFGLLVLSVSAGPVWAGPAEEAKAGKLFDQAESAYQAGHFREAIDYLLEAQRLAPDAVLHYNLARAYEGLGELDEALASYRAYIQADPKSKDRGAVEARIKTLEELKAQRAQEPVSPPVTPPPADKPKREPETASPVPWVIAGVGALGLGAGGVLGGLSLAKSNEAEDPSTTGADVPSLLDEASTFATAANVTFGVAGAVLAAGVIWGIVDVATLDAGDAASAHLRLELAGPSLRLTGRF